MGNRQSTSSKLRCLHRGGRRGQEAAAVDKDNNAAASAPVDLVGGASAYTPAAGVEKRNGKTLHSGGGSRLGNEVLTQDQVGTIQDSWQHVDGKIGEIMTEAFLALFSENADVKDRFFTAKDLVGESFMNGKNCSERAGDPSTVLHRHIPAVVRAISKVVRNLEHPDGVNEYLKILGKLHQQKGITSADLTLLGPHFVSSVVSHLPSHLRERRCQESWLRLFSAVSSAMRAGYPEVAYELSRTERACVRATLSAASATAANSAGGEEALLKMFRTCSTASITVPSVRGATAEEEMMLVEAMENHGVLLFKVAEDVVKELDHKSRLEQYLEKLGRYHEKVSVRKEYLDVMGPLFCQAVRPVLQAQAMWDAEVRETWLHLFRIISYHMRRGYIGDIKGSEAGVGSNALLTGSRLSLPRLSVSDTNQSPQNRAATVVQSGHLSPPDPGHLYAKHNNRRRISMDEIHDRRVRLQSQHCHLYQPSHHHLTPHQYHHHQRRRMTSSAISFSDYSGGGSPCNSCRHSPCMRSSVDVRRVSAGSGFCLLSPATMGSIGVTSSLLTNANAAAAEAKKRNRRGSLHQLVGLALKKESQLKPISRPRSKSTNSLVFKNIVKT